MYYTATSAYLWGNFLSPSTVDVWLGIVTGLSSVVHVEKGFVACLVERVSVQVILFWPLREHQVTDEDPTAWRWQFFSQLSATYPIHLCLWSIHTRWSPFPAAEPVSYPRSLRGSPKWHQCSWVGAMDRIISYLSMPGCTFCETLYLAGHLEGQLGPGKLQSNIVNSTT
jgi:hypothetical protein